ncbi:MAG: SOS response-associated peptidase [bacterium]|nr:SOS response-associated peptidase [bacterium]
MCGRYGFVDPSKIRERYEVENPQDLRDLKPRYNIAPSQWLPIITRDQVIIHNKVELMKWGLLPAWSSDPKKAAMMINARAETIHQKPSYQKPLRFQRCLIPVTHFFEWKQTKEGKVPYLIRLKNAEMFSFAGVYDVNEKVEDKPVKTYTIITTEPNSLVEPIHNRMPVILKKTTENIWLDPTITDPEKLLGLLTPFSPGLMEAYPIFSTVNDPANDYSDVIKGIPTI